jgi:hypothetical protein
MATIFHMKAASFTIGSVTAITKATIGKIKHPVNVKIKFTSAPALVIHDSLSPLGK